MHSSELVKGTLKTIILKLLKEKGKMYGYEITQCVKTLSRESIQLTEGALYPSLHALELEGTLTTESVIVNGRARKYYQLTPTGKSTAVQKIEALKSFMETLNEILLTDKSVLKNI
jgi:DNA-binding PadR family transcriptional regulator